MPQRITAGNRRLIDVLLSGQAGTIKEAAKLAEISERGANHALRHPLVRQRLEDLIRDRLRFMSFPRAAAIIDRLLNAQSEHVQADIAKHILAIHGVKPASDLASVAAGGLSLTIVMGDKQASIGAQTIDITPLSDTPAPCARVPALGTSTT